MDARYLGGIKIFGALLVLFFVFYPSSVKAQTLPSGVDQCNGDPYNCPYNSNQGVDQCNNSSWFCWENLGADQCNGNNYNTSCYYNVGAGNCNNASRNCDNNYGALDYVGTSTCGEWDYPWNCTGRNFFGAANTGVSCDGNNLYGGHLYLVEDCADNQNVWLLGSDWGSPGSIASGACGLCGPYIGTAYWPVSLADDLLYANAQPVDSWAEMGGPYQTAINTACGSLYGSASDCVYRLCPLCAGYSPGEDQALVNSASGFGLEVAGQNEDFASGAADLAQAVAGQFIDPTNPAYSKTFTGEILDGLGSADVPASEYDVSTEISILINDDLSGFWGILQKYYAGTVNDANQFLAFIGQSPLPGYLSTPPPYPSAWASWPPKWSSVLPFKPAASTQPLPLTRNAAIGVPGEPTTAGVLQ